VVELALVLPVLLLVTLAVLDAARVFAVHVALTNASREAAIYAGSQVSYLKWCRSPSDASQKAPEPDVSVPCPAGATSANHFTDPDNLAFRVGAEALGLDTARIVVDPPTCDGATCSASSTNARLVTVTVRYEVPLVTPMLGAIWGSPARLSATTTARIFQ
jgi:hypothetical protein